MDAKLRYASTTLNRDIHFLCWCKTFGFLHCVFRFVHIPRLKMAESIAKSDVTQQLLDMFHEIRVTLRENAIPISANFPIVEIDTDRSCELNCLGCTQMEDGVVLCIEMLLKKPGTNVFYSKEALIATLLHEFAHCITPPAIEDHHSKLFYSNFEKILR